MVVVGVSWTLRLGVWGVRSRRWRFGVGKGRRVIVAVAMTRLGLWGRGVVVGGVADGGSPTY